MAEEQKKTNWWTTLPGILTGLAATITAITGLIAVLYQKDLVHKQPVPTPKDAIEIAGKWAGQAKEPSGTTFRIEAQIYSSCKPREKCGTISVMHVPCFGELFLESAQDGDFEFRVDNFDSKSNLDVCQPGAGEHFKLGADKKLSYFASYSGATGTLERLSK